jgi:hypothetical protein
MKDSTEILLMLLIFISIFFFNKTFIFSVTNGTDFQSHLQDKGRRLECQSKLTNMLGAGYQYNQHWHFYVLSFFSVDLSDSAMTRVNKLESFMVPYDVPTAVCYSSFTFFSDFL